MPAPVPDTLLDALLEPPLESTEWILSALPGTGELPAGARATLVLDREGDGLHGFTGCRSFDGSYRMAGARITFAVSDLGGGACAEGEAQLETDYLEALRDAGGWLLRADTLELLGEEGVVARFHAPPRRAP